MKIENQKIKRCESMNGFPYIVPVTTDVVIVSRKTIPSALGHKDTHFYLHILLMGIIYLVNLTQPIVNLKRS